MQIRKADKYVFDVFQGNGYEGWSRLRRFHWGYKVIGGQRLSRENMELVAAKLEVHHNGGIENV